MYFERRRTSPRRSIARVIKHFTVIINTCGFSALNISSCHRIFEIAPIFWGNLFTAGLRGRGPSVYRPYCRYCQNELCPNVERGNQTSLLGLVPKPLEITVPGWMFCVLWTLHRDIHTWKRPPRCMLLLINVFQLNYPVHALGSCDRASWAKYEERRPTRCNN